jgi:hypothetical protein
MPAFPTFAGELPIALSEYNAAVSEQLGQSSRFKAALGGVLLSGLAFLGLEASTAPTAEAKPAAPSCYGDYCSGKYAGDTGCDKDAKTLTNVSMNSRSLSTEVTIAKDPSVTVGNGGPEKEVARLEVRYSERCGTAWARLNTRQGTGINYVGVEADDGYTQKRKISGRLNNGSPDGLSVSPMIYGRDHNYRAFVEGKQAGIKRYGDGTFWTGTK